MKRYYFDLHECGTVTRDEQGQLFAGVEGARHAALEAARDMMAAEVRSGKLCLGCSIVVRTAPDAVVFALPFADALAVTFGGT